MSPKIFKLPISWMTVSFRLLYLLWNNYGYSVRKKRTNNLDASGHSHDQYTLGEFKDDQLQKHTHSQQIIGSGSVVYSSGNPSWQNETIQTGNNTGRSGYVTRGKRKGINYLIKAL